MVEYKISLSLLIPGADMLSPQECEKNPKDNYDNHKLLISYIKGEGKKQKRVKEILNIKTRKHKLVTQNINICKEAYDYMLSTPTSTKFSKPVKTNKDGDVVKTVWDNLSIRERLKHHFDLIAHDFNAASYSYEILND